MNVAEKQQAAKRDAIAVLKPYKLKIATKYGRPVADAIDTLIASVEADDWVPVAERLPEEAGIYAVVIPYGGNEFQVAYDAYHGNGSWTHYQGHRMWLPLPTLPQPYGGSDD